uniref:Bromo domain-containing protein n=1 Tax=Periophthalmus magnuspinnatus TaxID=409849 RepID=A0A3B4A9X8_9GOBI
PFGDITAHAHNDGMSEFSNSDISLPEVCISSNTNSVKEEINYEVQQAYRIFSEFLTEKHKVMTSPFWNPTVNQDEETQCGSGGVCNRYPVNVRQSMCLHRMEEKFIHQEYETITEFVADFRLMLENCYRYHGVDHWLSKQAQKLEIMLEQKLTLLSRQRELEKKEAEEISAKEMDEWEQNLLSQAFPHNVETLWELPAIGHFLCLAQSALNLPEIVFFELERCLLMPRCSILLSKIMSSLLCQPQRRSTLHRRPVLPYRRWESELRQRVRTWFQSVGSSHDQTARAEHLGLCHQFFSVLGKSSPLEAKAFHMLPFYQRVWLLKGLCDHVYETQRDIQMAVLAQPIHECRESILGYDSKENAYIHFPHFCGADLRIYRQSPSAPPNFPFPSVLVEKVELLHRLEEEMPSVTKSSSDVYRDSFDDKTVKEELYKTYKVETIETDVDRCQEKSEFDLKSKRLKNEMGSLCPLQRSESTHKLCLSDEEHCYTGTSPTGSVTGSPLRKLSIETSAVLGDQRQRCCKNRNSPVKLEPCQSCCGSSELHRTQMSTEHTRTFCEKDVNDKISTKNKKWRKKKERELLSRVKPEQRQPVDRRRCRAKTPKPSESNTAIKRKNKKRKRAEKFHYFILICTNLDDLRELINKTEDELDDLESTKRKMSLWYGRRESVKDLHSTLIRLLNELTPWEPKLIKAHQRNRLRLKKEFEVFRSHPDYSNFVREESMSSSSSSSSSDNEGELGLLFEQFDLSSLFTLSGTVKDLSTELSADVPVTHKSHNCPKQLLSGNLDYSLKNTNRSELNHQSSDSFSSQKQTIPLSKPSVLHSVSGQPKSYTPIPTLLAKSVGNKVTLMKQPADHLEIDSKGTVVSTGDTNLSKLNNCSSGPPQNSSQKQVSYTVHKEQNPLVGTSSSNLKCKEMEPQQVVFLNPNILHSTDKEVTLSQQQSKDIISSEIDSTLCTSTNVAGFTIPESGTLVQQVPPSKNTGLTEASVCSSNIHSFFRSQPSAISNARSKVTQHCDVQPSAPQCSLHDITAPLSISKSTDSKQELKTVCIRESQSILVTTRGGNTGIVKVQKSTDHTVGFSKGPVITISPQFQALLVSKTSSVFSPNTGQSGSVSTASTGPTVQTGPETPSVSLNQEVSKYSSTTKTQGLTGSSVYTSTSNCGKTAVSCPLTVVKNANPALSNFITPPITTTAQTVFTNSNGISTAPAPATSRSSLKHLGFSSITVNSQPRNVTCPSTKSLSADISKNLMWSSNSKVHPATSQTTPSPISALSLKHKPLFVSNATGHFDKTSLSPPLCFPRPEDSSDMPRSTEVPDIAKGLLTKPTTTSSQTSLTNSVQRQIVINTSTRLAGGTRIVLNNAHFVVPPQGLGPGSHVLVISGHAPQVPGSSVKTEETVPLQGVNKGQVLLQPSARLPGLPAIRSSYVACTPAVSCAGQAPSPIITAPRIHSPNNAVVVNQIDTAANSPFLQTANTGRPTEGASIVSTFPSLLPVVSSVLTSASTVRSSFRSECLTTSTASVGLSLPNLPPPILSSAVFIQPIKTDPAHLLRAASTPCSQGLPSPAQMNKGLSISVASPVPSQHQTIRVASISSSTSTALMHMGLGSLAVKKQEHTAARPVSTIAQTHSVPPAASPGTRTLPCSGGNVKGESNSGTCDTAARSLPHRKSPTHCPVIVTNPAMEKHLEQTSFLEMHCPVTSELLISPDASVLSSGQCKATSTLPETPSGLLISAAALQTEDLPSQPSQMDSKFDN